MPGQKVMTWLGVKFGGHRMDSSWWNLVRFVTVKYYMEHHEPQQTWEFGLQFLGLILKLHLTDCQLISMMRYRSHGLRWFETPSAGKELRSNASLPPTRATRGTHFQFGIKKGAECTKRKGSKLRKLKILQEVSSCTVQLWKCLS